MENEDYCVYCPKCLDFRSFYDTICYKCGSELARQYA